MLCILHISFYPSVSISILPQPWFKLLIYISTHLLLQFVFCHTFLVFWTLDLWFETFWTVIMAPSLIMSIKVSWLIAPTVEGTASRFLLFDSAQLLIIWSIIGLQVHSGGNPDIADSFTGSHLIELSIVTAHCHDQIQDDIKNFADQLKPYPLVSVYIILYAGI